MQTQALRAKIIERLPPSKQQEGAALLGLLHQPVQDGNKDPFFPGLTGLLLFLIETIYISRCELDFVSLAQTLVGMGFSAIVWERFLNFQIQD
jgi:hypothetical protein